MFDEWGLDLEGNPLPLTVEPYLGSNSSGDRYGLPVEIPGLPQMPQKRVIRNPDGNEVVSATAVYADLEHENKFPLRSRVTIADGTKTRVGRIDRAEAYGLFGFVTVHLE